MPREFRFGLMGIPIEACWRCQNCKTINYSSGELICWPEKSNDTAIEKVTKIILDPRTNSGQLQDILNNKRCRVCFFKPQWARTNRPVKLWHRLYLLATYFSIIIVFFVFLLLSLMGRPIKLDNGVYYLDSKPFIIVICILIFVGVLWSIVSLCAKKRYENRVEALPEIYLPVVGTSDYLVVSYAKAHGKVIPTRQQAIAILSERYNSTNGE